MLILFIYGIAGDRSLRSLRERLTDLINHGSGKTSNNGHTKVAKYYGNW
jgi:hypothetical protein